VDRCPLHKSFHPKTPIRAGLGLNRSRLLVITCQLERVFTAKDDYGSCLMVLRMANMTKIINNTLISVWKVLGAVQRRR